MIDTQEVMWRSDTTLYAPEFRAFQLACEGPIQEHAVLGMDGADRVVCGYKGVIPLLGKVQVRSDGCVRMGRSLSRFRQELEGIPAQQADNAKMLSARQANDTLQAYLDLAESALPFLLDMPCEARRTDIVYDRSCAAGTLPVLKALAAAVKPTRKGVAWFDNAQGVPTGIMFRGRSVVHRVYDKGLEQGRSDLGALNMLRSEEQLRAGAVGLWRALDMSKREYDREQCRAILNERYTGEVYGEALPVEALVHKRQYLRALLALHPELLGAYKATVTKTPFYAMRRKVLKLRAEAVPVDLRVPEEAWLEEYAHGGVPQLAR